MYLKRVQIFVPKITIIIRFGTSFWNTIRYIMIHLKIYNTNYEKKISMYKNIRNSRISSSNLN